MGLTIRSDLVEAVDASHEANQGGQRLHLGASLIGRDCSRFLWYSFRWAKPEKFSGRMLRLFRRGHEEEARIVADLRRIGMEVHTVDPTTGKQFTWSALAGHAGGSQDGAAKRVPNRPAHDWYLLEFKTFSTKAFDALVKGGLLATKPEHYTQMQLYMLWSGLRKAIYVALNKDNEELHVVEVEFDEQHAREQMDKAERVIFSDEPLPKINSDPSFFKCTFCSAKGLCHGTEMPAVNCRTCAHATPTRRGSKDGVWDCELHKKELTPGEQRIGCEHHVYNPHLLVNHGEYVGGNAELNFAEYRLRDGQTIKNGTRSADVLSSAEISGIKDLTLLHADPFWLSMRGPDVRIVSLEPTEGESHDQV